MFCMSASECIRFPGKYWTPLHFVSIFILSDHLDHKTLHAKSRRGLALFAEGPSQSCREVLCLRANLLENWICPKVKLKSCPPLQHCGFQNNTRIIDITLEIFSTGISSSWVTLGSLERSLFRSVGLMSAAAVDSLLLKPPAGTPKPPAWTPRSGAPWKGITALSKVVTPKCLNQLIGWFFNDMWRFIILIFLCTQLTPWLMGWGLHHFLAIALVALVVVKLQESCWQACHHIVNVPKVFKASPLLRLLRHSLHLYPPPCIVIMTHVQIHPWTSAQLLWQQRVVSEAGLGGLGQDV